MYCFSFDLNPNWTEIYAGQVEILAYINRMADKYGLRQFTEFNSEVLSADWIEDDKKWKVKVRTNGEEKDFIVDFVVTAMGQLNKPGFPAFASEERRQGFGGDQFHTARWDHSVDLTDKTVAVIGTGASAV